MKKKAVEKIKTDSARKIKEKSNSSISRDRKFNTSITLS